MTRLRSPIALLGALVLGACLLVLPGCDTAGPNAGDGDAVVPGAFSLAHLDGLGANATAEARAAAAEAAVARGALDRGTLANRYPGAPGGTPDAVTRNAAFAFDLGDLRNTRSFYFLVGNSGDTPIVDVTLTSSNDAFPITPDAIDRIDPGKGVGVLPVLDLTAVHGTAPSGVGFTDLLPMGPNATTFTLRGTTVLASGDSVAVTAAVDVAVEARVADLRVRKGATEVDFTDVGGTIISPNLNGGQGAPIYFVNAPASEPFTLINAGNVPLGLELWDGTNSGSPTTVPLAPGDSLVRPIAALAAAVDPNNTIADPTRLRPGFDGRSYFLIYSQSGH